MFKKLIFEKVRNVRKKWGMFKKVGNVQKSREGSKS